MNFTDEFRNEGFVQSLLKEIHKASSRPVRIMEVCGGHTMAIRKYGIHNMLPQQIELLSGPG
ncbi:MAG: hydrogenase formation protein HypD, partial [Bacteroidales bacterium]